MVRPGADDAHMDPITFVPTGKAINNIDPISGVEIINRTLSVDSPDLSGRFRVSVIDSIPHPGKFTRDIDEIPENAGQRKRGNKRAAV